MQAAKEEGMETPEHAGIAGKRRRLHEESPLGPPCQDPGCNCQGWISTTGEGFCENTNYLTGEECAHSAGRHFYLPGEAKQTEVRRHGMKGPFAPDDLPTVNGRVYHLDLAPEELAQNVIVVGDPDRVPLLADEFLEQRQVDRFHRGFRSITGIAGETGMRVSIVTTGIGAPSTEIVLNELAALNEVDFHTMTGKRSFAPLNIIRIGTSGGINPATPLGTLVLTDYVIGLDNTSLFYNIPVPDAGCALLEEQARSALERAGEPGQRFSDTVIPYAARADRDLLAALEHEATALRIAHVRGITVSSPGFFAEQGRGVAGIETTFPRLLDMLGNIDSGPIGLKVENMEMEAGILLHFLAGRGYRGGAICAVINKRSEGGFVTDYRRQMCDAARIALRAFSRLTRH